MIGKREADMNRHGTGRGLAATLALALLCAGWSSEAAGGEAAPTSADTACTPAALEEALTDTPGREAAPQRPERVVETVRRDGSRSRPMTIPPFPLADGACRQAVARQAAHCPAAALSQAMYSRDIRRMIFVGYKVDLDCAAEFTNRSDIIGAYVDLWDEIRAAPDACARYTDYDARLAAWEGSQTEHATTWIPELTLARGYLAELCVSDQSARDLYARAARAGDRLAHDRLLLIINDRAARRPAPATADTTPKAPH